MKITNYTFNKCPLVPCGQYKKGYFYTTATLRIYTQIDEYYMAYRIPKGFITDLASTPSMFGFVYDKVEDEAKTNAAILHDFLYSRGNNYADITTRSFADNLLVAILESELQENPLPTWKGNLVKTALKVAGGFRWRKEPVKIWNTQKQCVDLWNGEV